MPWYEGTSLLHHLEDVHIGSDRNLIDVRFPVQYVIRPHQSSDAVLHDFRGYAGTIAGGVMRAGDEVTVLPSGFTTTVKAIWRPGGIAVDEAFAGAGGHRRAGRRHRHRARRPDLPPAQPSARRAGHRRDAVLDDQRVRR